MTKAKNKRLAEVEHMLRGLIASVDAVPASALYGITNGKRLLLAVEEARQSLDERGRS